MANYNYTFNQGEDLAVELAIYDKTTNVAVDLTAATDVILTLTAKEFTLAKYSKEVITGYETLAIKSGAGNEHILTFNIVRSTSKNFTIGRLQANVLVELPDVTLTNKRTEYTYPYFALVNKGLTREIEI